MSNYFQAYQDYFWQWEDDGQFLSIPKSSTIAYRPLITEIIEHLSPQGIPPFGTLLLAVIATNPQGEKDLSNIERIVNAEVVYAADEAFVFLNLLTELPVQYKSGANRLLLFQAIFQDCHYIQSIATSAHAASSFNHLNSSHSINYEGLTAKAIAKDFRPLEILAKKLPNTKAIIDLIAGLPKIENELVLEEITDKTANPLDFIEQLIDNDKTFYVGSLIRHIWSGLNIPVHSKLPSEQPIGGVSDLTNKGNFDRLLISEFANDDLIFLNRIANNEALYIQREIPPQNNNQERILLIDVSLKNWGTPKTIAFAVMTAIAKHPKTAFSCQAFTLGYKHHPINFDSVEGLIAGLQFLDPGLNAAQGLTQFFVEFPVSKNREIVLITHQESMQQPAFLKVINENHAAIDYLIHTDEIGTIDVFKKQQSSKRHLQRIVLPLDDLWKKDSKKTKVVEHSTSYQSNFPLLVFALSNKTRHFVTEEGEVFMVSNNKSVLRAFSKSAKSHFKGSEIIYTNLPAPISDFILGKSKNGDNLLFKYNHQTKNIDLLNLNTGELKLIPFGYGQPRASLQFSYHNYHFYYSTKYSFWSIDEEGNIQEIKQEHFPSFEDLEAERAKKKELIKKRSNLTAISGMPLRNIKRIYIGENGHLFVNSHELMINSSKALSFSMSKSTEKMAVCAKGEYLFKFDDGSSIEVIQPSLLVFKSSDTSIPTFYIPCIIDYALGVATVDQFAGNTYFYKEPLFHITLFPKQENGAQLERIVQEYSDYSYSIIQALCKQDKLELLTAFPQSILDKITSSLSEIGVRYEINQSSSNEYSLDQKVIEVLQFYKKYIRKFIYTIIQKNGA